MRSVVTVLRCVGMTKLSDDVTEMSPGDLHHRQAAHVRVERDASFGPQSNPTRSTFSSFDTSLAMAFLLAFWGACLAFGRWLVGLARYRRFFAATAGLGISVTLVLATVIAWHAIQLPTPSLADLRRQTNSIHVVDVKGRTLARRGERHTYLTTEQLPQHLISAVLATEDRRFVNHIGIDVVGLMRATLRNIRAGRYVQGGSTITQQLAKNVFLQPKRTMSRKIQELILSFWLEVRLSKKQILELYLNRVYFGGGAYGIEAAANRYFGKPAHNLTLGESAVLAGLLKAPSRYSPQRDPARTLKRARVVLQNMIVTGAITHEEALGVMGKPIHFVTSRPRKRARYANYAIDWIYEKLPQAIANPKGDLVVHTTIDRDLQIRSQKLVGERLNMNAILRKADQAAVVLLDSNGGVKALVGGRSYKSSQFNRAIKARRQPGSAFKPFVYAAAVESGFTPDTVAYDEPITVKKWTPRNYGKTHRGQVSLRTALAQSINTVAVRIYLEIGRQQVVSLAERLGITSNLHTLPSLALGTAEVTPLELAGAYVPFSNGGFTAEPHVISKVTTVNGTILYQRDAAPDTRVLKPHVVSAMNDMMSTTLASGTGRHAAIPPHPAAGKTGTTQDFKDAWFVGYTSHYTASVWIGNDKAVSMGKVVGGGLPATLWRDIMTVAHEDVDPVPLPGSYADRVRQEGPIDVIPEPEAIEENSPGLIAKVFGFEKKSARSASRIKAARKPRVRGRDLSPNSSRWRNVFSRQ